MADRPLDAGLQDHRRLPPRQWGGDPRGLRTVPGVVPPVQLVHTRCRGHRRKKFKAVNNRDKHFTVAKVAKRIEQVEAAPDKQVSLTDPDARSMATSGKGTGIVGYNVQIAVDVEHHLIVAHEVTNIGTDRAQLASMGGKARDAIGCEEVAVLADRGYYSADEVLVLRLSRRIDGPTFLTMYRYARHWGRGVVHLRGGPELWGRFSKLTTYAATPLGMIAIIVIAALAYFAARWVFHD